MVKSLREWRRERLLSLVDLAKVAGVSNKTLVQIEHGRQAPRYRTMRRICEALKVKPREVAEFLAVIEGDGQGELAAAA